MRSGVAAPGLQRPEKKVQQSVPLVICGASDTTGTSLALISTSGCNPECTPGWYLCTSGWYLLLVPLIGTSGWYLWLVPLVGASGWCLGSVPLVSASDWYL